MTEEEIIEEWERLRAAFVGACDLVNLSREAGSDSKEGKRCIIKGAEAQLKVLKFSYEHHEIIEAHIKRRKNG